MKALKPLLFAIALLYFVVAYTTAEANPFDWSMKIRGMVAFFVAAVCATAYVWQNTD